MRFYRILAVVALLIGAAVAPQAAIAAAAVGAAFFFPRFWEAVVIGVVLDALYATPEPRWFGFQFVYTVLIAASLLAVWRLKKSLRWYSRN
ncbi:MAG: hypothetical protein G01um101417_25 [Parcubacteria group bacterium Gr01-1014_17]|nr:MAG: hypothetical protein G01um101417_25 [Parcubacteria group bacterium Gr01-1014_17]